MAITYTIDEASGVVLEVWEGTVTGPELGEYWARMLSDPKALACGRSLADLRKGQPAFTGSELALAVKNVVVPRLTGRKWKTAVLVGTKLQFGLARQYSVFSEAYSSDQIFEDREQALAWLLAA